MPIKVFFLSENQYNKLLEHDEIEILNVTLKPIGVINIGEGFQDAIYKYEVTIKYPEWINISSILPSQENSLPNFPPKDDTA